jgi:hypothetical protein
MSVIPRRTVDTAPHVEEKSLRGGAVAAVHARTLQRAAEIVGGEQELALRLGVTPSHLALWLRDLADPPMAVFFRAVDIVLEHDAPPKGSGSDVP